MKRNHTIERMRRAAIILGGASLLPLSPCSSDAALEFRNVASDSIKNGVLSIVTGTVEGIFAVVDPNTTSSSTTN